MGPGDPSGGIGSTLVVQPNGSATLTDESSPPVAYTMTLPRSLVSKLYRDLVAALPLAALPQPTVQDEFAGSLVISVAGQTSPNILGASGIAGKLGVDVRNIYLAFPFYVPEPGTLHPPNQN
jgi:hypothetical protein